MKRLAADPKFQSANQGTHFLLSQLPFTNIKFYLIWYNAK
jgi:hypothetical protein